MVRTGTLAAATDGSVTIAGDIAVLHCPGPVVERLQVLFEGVEVATLDSDAEVLLGAGRPLATLQVSALLRAAGIDPAKATQHQLQIKRTGSACIASFAIFDDVLAAVTLDFQPPLQVTLVQSIVFCKAPYEFTVTDLSATPMPYALTKTCGTSMSTEAHLDLTTPQTVTYAVDWFSTADESLLNLLFDVKFPVAGKVTVTVVSGWMQSAPCNGTDVADQVDYGDPAVMGTQFRGPTVINGGLCPFPPGTAAGGPITSDVAAGQTIRFRTQVGEERTAFGEIGSAVMKGSGPQVTIKFTPAP